jgi:hypothetical protein
VCTSASVNVRERRQNLGSCIVSPQQRNVDVGFTARYMVKCFDERGGIMNCPSVVGWNVAGDGGVRIGTISHDARNAAYATFRAQRTGTGTVTALPNDGTRSVSCTARVRVREPNRNYPDDTEEWLPNPTATPTATPSPSPSPSPNPTITPTPSPTPSPNPGEFAYCRILPSVVSFAPSGGANVEVKCFDSTHRNEVACPAGASFTWWSMPFLRVTQNQNNPKAARVTFLGGTMPSGGAYVKITYSDPANALAVMTTRVCTAVSVNVH